MKEKTLQAIKPLAYGLALSIAAYLILTQLAAYLHKNLGIEPHTLIVPLLGYFAMRAAAKTANAVWQDKKGQGLNYLLSGIAASFLVYTLIVNDPLALEQQETALHAILQDLIVYLITIIGAVVLYKISRLIEEKQWLTNIASLVGLILAAYASWHIFHILGREIESLEIFAYVAVAGFVAVALSLLAVYGRRSDKSAVAALSQWATKSQLRNYAMGALIAVYIVMIRPLLTDSFEYTPLIEWLIILGIGARVARGVQHRIDKEYAGEDTKLRDLLSWERRHHQQIEEKNYRQLDNVAFMQELFVEKGKRGPLMVYLMSLLRENDVAERNIARLLDPLIAYRDEDVPLFAFGWEKKRVMDRNKQARREILDDIMLALDEFFEKTPEEIIEVIA